MAEEITTTSEKYEFDSAEMDLNSAENPLSPPRARRHSLSEKPDTAKRRVPIHLRASTGSCHDLCKFGKKHYSEEKAKEPFRRRISKSLPNVPISLKTFDSEPVREAASRSSPNGSKPVKTTASSDVQNTKKPSSLVNSALSGNKTRLPNLSCSVLEQPPEIIKREISLFPSEKVEAPVEEGSSKSNDNKMLRADKKTSDQTVNHSSSEKAKLIKANKPFIDSGQKATASVTLADKGSESLTSRLSSKLYLGKTASSKAREEAGRVKLSLSSPVNYRNRTEKSNGEASERPLHFIKTETEESALSAKARKTGGVKPSSPPSRVIGIRVIKTESESKASTSASSPVSPSCVKSLSSSPHEEKDGDVGIEDAVSIETEEIHARAKSPSSSSHKDDDYETIDHINNEASELIEDKTVSSEIKNHDTNPTSSLSHEEEEDIYSSSSESSSHGRSSSPSSLEENSEEINGELVSDETIFMDIGKSQSPKEIRTSLRKSRSIDSIDTNNCSSMKLKFRRGKIIDLQSENNVPKRIKFRRARNSDNNNKMDDFASEGRKSINREIGNVKPGTPPNRTLRKVDSFISDKKKSADVKPGTPSRSLRKSRSVASEDKYPSSVSLSNREKTVDPQTGNTSPTRLKFTRGRVPSVEDAKSDSRRMSIKKVGGNNEAVGFGASSKNVVLKHPEVQSKNSGQVLLNNVIEETASKLVGSRKNKVMALVGAFETVISLHDTKPAASSRRLSGE
ncbi:hypothetical protein CASFOL_015153 [Castilleja foliolosa]|uniref:Calmodulin-binding domain-containing protein n=1 Tax=Castilleja foliolosa TaxID=1961234 RepID=A0ABD3DCX2_9LAMI